MVLKLSLVEFSKVFSIVCMQINRETSDLFSIVVIPFEDSEDFSDSNKSDIFENTSN